MRATLTHNRKLLAWLGLSAVLLVASISVTGWSIYSASTDQHRTNRTICRAVNRINDTITATLERSRANLPKLVYFQQHPAELASQEAEIARQLRSFAPQIC